MTNERRETVYQYPVRLPSDLRDALHAVAERQDRPVSRVIRDALRRYVEAQEVTPVRGA